MEKEFIDLIQEHERIILKICNVYCPAPADREDLYQDILIQLWKAYPKFNHRSKVSTWMYRIALNTAITRYRKQQKMPFKEALSDQIAAPHTIETEETLQALHHAISELNPIEKAITMLYLDGQQYREIGEVLGLSESNVGFKINQIKRKLKEKLNTKTT